MGQSWCDYIADCEDAAYGEFLVDTVASIFGVKPEIAAIDHAVRVHFGKEVSLKFTDTGITAVASISRAYCAFHITLTGVDTCEGGENILRCRVLKRLADCVGFIDRVQAEQLPEN